MTEPEFTKQIVKWAESGYFDDHNVKYRVIEADPQTVKSLHENLVRISSYGEILCLGLKFYLEVNSRVSGLVLCAPKIKKPWVGASDNHEEWMEHVFCEDHDEVIEVNTSKGFFTINSKQIVDFFNDYDSSKNT